MTTVAQMQTQLALRLHDVANAEISAVQLITFINIAVADVTNAGWLIYLEEDESLTEAAHTYTFTVPSNIAYISRILRQNRSTNTYDYEIDRNAWRLGLDGGVATLFFDETRYVPDAGAKLKLVGQKRPATYTTGTDPIDLGLDAVLREGTLFYAFQFVAAGRSEYAAWRQSETTLAYQRFQQLLSMAPQQFRMKPNSKYVPGR